MKVYGQLESAQFEVLSSNPSALPTGRVFFSTPDGCPKCYTGVSFPKVTLRIAVGTRAAPSSIIAGTGIVVNADGADQLHFIQGSGGSVVVSANPQVSAGQWVGQQLILKGRSDTNYVVLANGTGLSLNGDWFGGEDNTLTLSWDGTNWSEDSRR